MNIFGIFKIETQLTNVLLLLLGMILTIQHLSEFMTIPVAHSKRQSFSPIQEKEMFYPWFFDHFRRSYPPPYPSGAVFYHWLTLFETECLSHFPSDITIECYPSFMFSFFLQDGLFPFLEGNDCEEFMNRIIVPMSLSSVFDCKLNFYMEYEYKPMERILTDMDHPMNQQVFHKYCQFLRQYHQVTCLTPSKWKEMKDCLDFIQSLKYRLCEGLKDYPWIQKPLQILDQTETCYASAFLELCQPWMDSSIRKNRHEWLKKPTYSILLTDRIMSIPWTEIDKKTQLLMISYFQQYMESLLKDKYHSHELNYEKWSQVLCSTFPWDGLTMKKINELWFHLIGRLQHFEMIHHSFQWKWIHHLFQTDKLWHCPTTFLFPEKLNWTSEDQHEIDIKWKQAESIFFTQWFHDIVSKSTKYPFKEVSMPCYVSIQNQWLQHRQSPLRVQSVYDIVYKENVYNIMEIQENGELKRQLSRFFRLENRYGKKGWETFPSYWVTKENPIIFSIRKGLQEVYSQMIYLNDEPIKEEEEDEMENDEPITEEEKDDDENDEEDNDEMEYVSENEENWDALFTD